jgi:hypothetical protein
LATVKQWEERHGPSDEKVKPLLEDATSLILEELSGSEAEWVDDDEAVVPAIVVATCIQVAYRAWSNPDGVTSERLGAASRTLNSGADVLYLTKNEARNLRRAGGTSGITSVAIETPYYEDPSVGETSQLDFLPLD